MSDAIQYIEHADIDKAKWDDRIANACNSLIYARSVYLDAMSPGWDALVYGDYDAIMPVTWRSKLGIRYICQPAFCQQLGLFYNDEKFRRLVPEFLARLAADFRLTEINLNYDNEPPDGERHNNYMLPLSQGYNALYDQLSPRFVQSLKRAARYPMKYISEDNPTETIELYRELYANRTKMRSEDFNQFVLLTKNLMTTGQALVRSARQPDGTFLAATVLLRDDKRFYNIINASTADGRTLEANYFLYNKMLEELAPGGLLFDFEGSDLPGVAAFYHKFNPLNQPYFFWKSDRLPAVVRWLKGS